jgi:hypothetical protein
MTLKRISRLGRIDNKDFLKFQEKLPSLIRQENNNCNAVWTRFATVRFMTFNFYDPCRIGPNTPEL